MKWTEQPRIWLVLILVLTFGIHAPSIDNDFVFDDNFSVKTKIGYTDKDHKMIAKLQPLALYFTSHYLYDGDNGVSRGYRPVSVLSYALVYHAWGKHVSNAAMPQHLLNVVVQTLNTWLVFLLVLVVCRRPAPALLAALVFGVHAVHNGAVASIIGRCELLAFLFGALATLAFSRSVRTSKVSVPHLGLAGLLLLLALCSKESAISWVVMAPLFELARRWAAGEAVDGKRIAGLAAAAAVVPVAIFVGLYSNATAGIEYRADYVGNPLAWEPTETRLASAAVIWVYGIYKVLAPFSLSCDYGPIGGVPMSESLSDPKALGAIVLLVGIVVLGLWRARRAPLFFLALAAFFGFWFVTSNVPFSLETVFAERLLYTPSVALSFLVAGLAVHLPRGVARAGLVAVVIWCGACSVLVFQRMDVWKNSRTLFEHDLQKRPGSLRCLVGMVSEIQKYGKAGTQGERDSVRYYEQILEHAPGYPMAALNLGLQRMREKNRAAATKLFQAGLESPLLHKGFTAEEGAKLAMNLGRVHHIQKQLPQAERMYEQSVQWRPNYQQSHLLLLRCQLEQARIEAAEQALIRTCRIFQAHPRQILQAVVQSAGDASATFREAVEKLAKRIPQ